VLLENKTAVVTGIGPGMGREIALAFARHGAKLAIGARSRDMLDAVTKEIGELGGQVIARATDLANGESCQALVKAAVDRFGGVDVLVQNGAHAGDWSSVENADPGFWRHMMDVNLFGALHLFQAALPSMKAKGDGRIIFVNSGAGNNRAPMGLSSYAASKAALASLVRSIALECGRYGIRCNGVHLGMVDGPNVRPWIAGEAARAGKSMDEFLEGWYDDRLPLRYIPPPEQCAGTVLYLASDLARPVTGQAISVNGGEWFGVR
jgi:NAD(P)-dependent dehydrogenase (short-subunit alcohol dehydrogenase family)